MPFLVRIALLALLCAPALAREGATADAAGLGGFIVVTPDADWREQWNAAINRRPDFRLADSVAQGEVLHVLTFISNPAPGLGNRADVRCDVQVSRPDGSLSVNRRDVACYTGIVNGDPGHAYLAAPTLSFRAEPGDLRGTWTVRVDLHDRQGGADLPLTASFTVLD